MKTKFLSLTASLLIANGSLKAQLLADISFGYDQTVFNGDPSPFAQAGNDIWGKLKDSSGTLLTSANSVAGIGYFTSAPSSFSADTTVFDNFVFLATGSIQNNNGIINLNVTQAGVDVTAANGKQAFFAFFNGITDVNNYANAVELGLVSALSWDNFSGNAPGPTPPPLLEFRFGKTTIGAGVLIGSEEDDSRFADNEGFNYKTAAVPEPSTYALLIGSLALLCVLRRR